MSSTLFSRDWYRIAELKPALRRHVSVHPHRYRGRRWYVLEDHSVGKVQRLSPESYWIVGLMNGKRTVDELWTLSAERLGEDMPTHEEMLQLLANLYQANLIRMDISGDVSELFQRDQDARRQRWMSKLKSPLSMQIPLVDPERFLQRTERWVAPLFTKTFAAIWLVLVMTMLVLAGQHWDELTKNISDKVLAADNLILLWLIYPIIKLLHELGHGYAVKRGGGSVHEMGVMLLVLMPMPYVNASACASFANKHQRMLVGAAGMLVELFIAAIAMLVWVSAEGGFVKSIAYNILFIAGVSTLLVNGNPLLRFDGYYVLADYLEMPNLAQRANQMWAWLAKRVLFGVKNLTHPAYDRREAAWLTGYGFAALVYRLVLMVTIFLFVAQQYFVIGVILAVWSVVGTWVWPNFKLLLKPFQGGDFSSGSRSPKWVVPAATAAVLYLIAIQPFPLATTVEGVVQLTDEQRVIAGENCFLHTLHVQPGAAVEKGQLLISCDNPSLHGQQKILQWQLAEAQSQRQGVWEDAVQMAIYDEELQRLKDEIADNDQRLAALQVYASAEGIWWMQKPEDAQGRFIKRGDLLGHLIRADHLRIRAMVPEQDVKLVREHTDQAVLLQASQLQAVITPKEWQLFPAASQQLVSPVLAENGGGTVVMDPSAEKPQTLSPFFLVDVRPETLPEVYVDERIYLKFEHPSEALIFRIYRTVRRTFLEYFDV